MATLHTIQLNGSVGTRTSKTRQYVACVVATVTEALHTRQQALLEKAERELEVALETARELVRQHGDLPACRVQHDANIQAFFERKQPIMDRLLKTTRLSGQRLHEAAEKELNHPDPWKQPSYMIIQAHDNIESLKTQILACRRYLGDAVGSQLVLSWHLTRSAASKALTGRLSRHYTDLGYSVAVRTDIVVK